MSESATVMVPEPMPLFGPVQLAAAGFLARYSGRTRDAYALDLKTYFAWCATRGAEVFEMTRPHGEVVVGELDGGGGGGGGCGHGWVASFQRVTRP